MYAEHTVIAMRKKRSIGGRPCVTIEDGRPKKSCHRTVCSVIVDDRRVDGSVWSSDLGKVNLREDCERGRLEEFSCSDQACK